MTSKVNICNIALLQLGADTITSLTDDTKEARHCNLTYDLERQKLLRAHPWNFAIKRAELQLLTTTPAFEYSYEYQLPNDCLRVLSLYNDKSNYVIEGRKLLSNTTNPKIVYIKNEEDTVVFDSTFSQLLSLAIAVRIGYSITGSSSIVDVLQRQFRTIRGEAKQWDGQEGRHLKWDDGEWLDNFFDN